MQSIQQHLGTALMLTALTGWSLFSLERSSVALPTMAPMRCYYQGGFTPTDRCTVTIQESEIVVQLTEYQRPPESSGNELSRRRPTQPEPRTLNLTIPIADIWTLVPPDQIESDEPLLVIGFVAADPSQGYANSFLQLNPPDAVTQALTQKWAKLDQSAQRLAIRDRVRQVAIDQTADQAADQAAAETTDRDRSALIQQLRDTKSCPGCDLRGADLSGAKLNGANLLAANLTGATLTDAELSADLTLASLTNANLKTANLTRAMLQYASLDNATLTEATLDLANLQGANLSNAVLTAAKLQGTILRQADLTGANLENANLTDYRVYGTSPVLAGLSTLSLAASIIAATVPSDTISTDLTGAILTGANLQQVDLDSAILTNAVLRDANLTDAKLRDSDLETLNLCGATLPDGSRSQQGC